MERLADLGSIIKTLKAGLQKPNPANPDRKMWLLTDLDKKRTAGKLWRTIATMQNHVFQKVIRA